MLLAFFSQHSFCPISQALWENVGLMRDLANCYSLNRFEGVADEEQLQELATQRKEEDRFLAGKTYCTTA